MRLPLGKSMNIDPKIVQELVNFVSRHNGYGNQDEALFNIMWGLNNLNPGFNLPNNTERYGYIFLTRPDLNLSYNNICDHPYLAYLVDSREESVMRAIRIMLDNDSFDIQSKNNLKLSAKKFNSRLFSKTSPFLNIISNSAISCSGWRDLAMDTYTSRDGRRKENWTIADGITDFMGQNSYSISCRSLPGDVILRMHELWLHYMSSVMRGQIFPKPENLWQGRIDYNTRIFRLITDSSRTFVTRISSTGPGLPVSAPSGAASNFSIDQVYNPENDQVTINFICNGERHNHIGLVDDFNGCVAMRNPALGIYLPVSDRNKTPPKSYRKLTTSELLSNIFNFYTTPLINPETMALEWWLLEADYKTLVDTSSNDYLTSIIDEAAASLNRSSTSGAVDDQNGYFESINKTANRDTTNLNSSVSEIGFSSSNSNLA